MQDLAFSGVSRDQMDASLLGNQIGSRSVTCPYSFAAEVVACHVSSQGKFRMSAPEQRNAKPA